MSGTAGSTTGSSAGGTTVAVLQPGYLPWLGFFDQLDRADIFVIYDDVAFDKQGWRNRNRIKTKQGIQWLTVPVVTAGRLGQPNNEVRIDRHQPWQRKHLRSLKEAYARAPAFDQFIGPIEAILSKDWDLLIDVDMAFIYLFARWLGLDETAVARSSTLGIGQSRNERLLAICQRFGATRYLSGNAAQAYLDEQLFREKGIEVVWQNYNHPVYEQLHGEFEPFLSIVDLFFNCGDGALEILRKGRVGAAHY